MPRTPFLVVAAFTTALMGHAGEMPDFSGLDTDADGRIREAEYNAAIDAWRAGPKHLIPENGIEDRQEPDGKTS